MYYLDMYRVQTHMKEFVHTKKTEFVKYIFVEKIGFSGKCEKLFLNFYKPSL